MTLKSLKWIHYQGFRIVLSAILIAGMSLFDVPRVSSQEKPEPTSCRELTQPKNQVEVQELLACILKVRRERDAQRKAVVNQKSLEGSQKLSSEISEKSGMDTSSKSTGRKQIGSYHESVTLTEQILHANPSLKKSAGAKISTDGPQKKVIPAYTESVILTKRIQRRLQAISAAKEQNP